MGHVVFAKSVSNAPGHNVLVWTDEVLAIDIEKADLAQVSWYEANNDATEMRLAVKIADDWYVSDTSYVRRYQGCNDDEQWQQANRV